MAITALNNGSLSDQEFLRTLARIDETADGLATATDRVAARARSIPQSSINGQPAARWARNKQTELSPLQGSIRNRINQALRGNNTEPNTNPPSLDRIAPTSGERLEPLFVYAETSQQGIVLAMIDDGQYHREAALLGQRNATGSALNTTDAVRTQVGALYPWGTNNSAYTGLSTDSETRLAQYTLSHDHGQLTTLLNQSSGRIIAEQQRKSLSRMPTTTPLIATEESFQLWVNRTYPTGPLDVSLMTPGGSTSRWNNSGQWSSGRTDWRKRSAVDPHSREDDDYRCSSKWGNNSSSHSSMSPPESFFLIRPCLILYFRKREGSMDG
uniref:DUF7094 domain-containing protein n=1 Tax=Halococcus thailandensis TaxID=335952 RepID=UPI000A6D4338|nr:hypothetical protein [Halococcus thailandensis]